VTNDQLRVRITFAIVRITTRNQFFMPGELPLVLLALIADRSQGGYELLGELERRYGPTYRPSPGSVYPALSALRAEQLVAQGQGGRSSAYRVTAAGRGLLANQRDVLRRIESRTSVALEPDASLQPALARFAARVTRLSGRVDRAAVERILDTAARSIADLEVRNGQ
jgi:DNA-binding PadR family transcriptional regulator